MSEEIEGEVLGNDYDLSQSQHARCQAIFSSGVAAFKYGEIEDFPYECDADYSLDEDCMAVAALVDTVFEGGKSSPFSFDSPYVLYISSAIRVARYEALGNAISKVGGYLNQNKDLLGMDDFTINELLVWLENEVY